MADGASQPVDDAVRESWMHVEIDRLRDGDDPAQIVDDIQRVLRDVREAVEDWEKMHARVTEIVEGLRDDPPPLDPDEVRQSGDLLEWLADEHFTFLGYREYQLELSATATTTSARSPAPGSASCGPTRRCRSPSAGCPSR